MKINIESTSKIVTLSGTPARVWEGKTERGIPVICFVTRVAVSRTEDASEFEKDLQEHAAPSPEVAVIDARMIL